MGSPKLLWHTECTRVPSYTFQDSVCGKCHSPRRTGIRRMACGPISACAMSETGTEPLAVR